MSEFQTIMSSFRIVGPKWEQFWAYQILGVQYWNTPLNSVLGMLSVIQILTVIQILSKNDHLFKISIVKILNLYIILLCTHLYHFFRYLSIPCNACK